MIIYNFDKFENMIKNAEKTTYKILPKEFNEIFKLEGLEALKEGAKKCNFKYVENTIFDKKNKQRKGSYSETVNWHGKNKNVFAKLKLDECCLFGRPLRVSAIEVGHIIDQIDVKTNSCNIKKRITIKFTGKACKEAKTPDQLYQLADKIKLGQLLAKNGFVVKDANIITDDCLYVEAPNGEDISVKKFFDTLNKAK